MIAAAIIWMLISAPCDVGSPTECEEALELKLSDVTRERDVLRVRLSGCQEKLTYSSPPEDSSLTGLEVVIGVMFMLGIGIAAVSL